ncbi:MAG: (2Fe-2S)-binding protein [Thermodesulfobacteriota bacterium]
MHPQQVICFCTGTRAEEVAAAILGGARTPEELSFRTGVRTGCKVECIQPVLRLLEAAGVRPARPKGWQWYGRTATVFEVPAEVRRKYSARGFYFDEDEALLRRVACSPVVLGGEACGKGADCAS